MSAAGSSSQASKVTRRAGVVMVGTLGSRILGALRDAVIAALFPLRATDAFFVAFTIPNTFRAVLAEGALSGVLVPSFSQAQKCIDLQERKQRIAAVSGLMLMLLVLVTVLGVWLSRPLAYAYAAGHAGDRDKLELIVTLTRLLFPYLLLMGVVALATAALHVRQRFAWAAAAPMLLNLSLITLPWLLLDTYPTPLYAIRGLVWAVLVGGVLHAFLLLWRVYRCGAWVWPTWPWRHPQSAQVLRALVPIAAGFLLYQGNIMLTRMYASFLPDGAQSFLYYSQRIVEIPQGLFALSLATASLPSLTRLAQAQQFDQAGRLCAASLRMALFLALPAAVCLLVAAEDVIALVLGRGRFDASAVAKTGECLRWMALSVGGVALNRGLVPLFYARGDTRTPMIGTGVNVVVFALMGGVGMQLMAHAGIALGTSIAALAQLGVLLWRAEGQGLCIPWRRLWAGVWRMLLASLAMALAMLFCQWLFRHAYDGYASLWLRLFAVLVAGGMSYALSVWALRLSEWQSLLSRWPARQPSRVVDTKGDHADS